MKIVTVIGARPQFIKAAVLSRKIAQRNDISEILVHTGQHHDSNMSEVFFKELDMPTPNVQLDIHGGSHAAMTGRMMIALEDLLQNEKPNCIVVYGDTNSTLAGALAAVKLQIPIAHVEAGLRSFNMSMPEEINRILTDRISNYLFCPTQTAMKNLNNEGIAADKIFYSGDIMYDSIEYFKDKAQLSEKLQTTLNVSGHFALATIHRAENTDDIHRLRQIFKALNIIAEKTNVILPLHPRTRKIINKENIECKNIQITDPVGYFDMIALLRDSSLVLTDSGGLQKEAYFMGKTCLTLRTETEWVELVESGHNFICDANIDLIVSHAQKYFGQCFTPSAEYFGSGASADIILDTLVQNN